MKLDVLVVGAGAAACALALDIASCGAAVGIYSRHPDSVERVTCSPQVLKLPDGSTQSIQLINAADLDKHDLADTTIFVVISSDHQAEIILAHYAEFKSAQAIHLVPGHTGGLLKTLAALRAQGIHQQLLMSETQLPFVARSHGTTHTILRRKQWIDFAAVGERENAIVFAETNLRQWVRRSDVKHKSLVEFMVSNTTAILQPAIFHANMSRIAAGDTFLIYREGFTDKAVNLAKALDDERLALAASLGVHLIPIDVWFARVYDRLGMSFKTAVSEAPGFRTIRDKLPRDHRFGTEHVRTGLIPMRELAECVGTPHTVIDRVCGDLCSFSGADLFSEGVTLRTMGLHRNNARGLLHQLQRIEGGRYSWSNPQ